MLILNLETEKIDGHVNNPENSSTTKISEHIPCGYSMPTIWQFDHLESKHTLYRGKDFMKKFCASLREHERQKHTEYIPQEVLNKIRDKSITHNIFKI